MVKRQGPMIGAPCGFSLCAQAADYTFQRTVDNASGAQVRSLEVPFHLNNRGEVAFIAHRTDGNWEESRSPRTARRAL